MHGLCNEALEVFRRVPSTLLNEVTILCILNACSHSGFVEKAQEIFDNSDYKSHKIYTAMVTGRHSSADDCFFYYSRWIASVVQLCSIALKV